MNEHGQIKLEDDETSETSAGAEAECCENEASAEVSESIKAKPVERSAMVRLRPLFLIVAYLVVVPGAVALLGGAWTIEMHMRQFMGGFFLAFSFFKLLDLKGFVEAYRGYDFVAGAFTPYAWFYPFIELTLGVLYLAQVLPLMLNSIVIVLMLVGLAGVVRAILSRKQIRCACLGTVLDLPMTWVTFLENALMALMAGFMLYRTFVGTS